MVEGYDNDMTATATATAQRKRGAALEDAILEAAYAELSEVGYTAFSVEGVAVRARTGKASIYRRWPSRAQLLLDAVCSQSPLPRECGLDVQFGPEVSTADALRQIACTITDILNSPAGNVMRSIKCEATGDPDLARAIDERFQAPRRAMMIGLLRRGIERGEVRPGADTPVVAEVLPAVLMHRVILQREPVTAARIIEIVEQVLLPLIEPH